MFFLTGLVNYIRVTPQEFEAMLDIFAQRGIAIEMTYQQFKTFSVLPLIVALVWGISGGGVLRRKEWARKTTVYFAFFIAAIIFLAVLMQPEFISLVFIQLIYVGILIVYFTNRNVERYFVEKKENI